MIQLTTATKAIRMREAFGLLVGQFIHEGKRSDAARVLKAVCELDNDKGQDESTLARLYDIIMEAKA